GIRPAGSDDSARRGSTYPQVEVRGPLRVAQMFTASHWSVDQHIWNPTLCECCRIAHGCRTIDGLLCSLERGSRDCNHWGDGANDLSCRFCRRCGACVEHEVRMF